MRSECVLCGVSFAVVARSPQPCKHVKSGFVASRRSWCVACDSLDAPVRARRVVEAERRAHRRAEHRAYMREYNATRRPPHQSRAHAFKCNGCRRMFKRHHEAWRLVNGVRERLGLCRYCADVLHSRSKHDQKYAPREGWAAYLRHRRQQQKLARAVSSEHGRGDAASLSHSVARQPSALHASPPHHAA